MRNLVSKYVIRFQDERRVRLRLLTVVLALAVVVAGVVFWQLRYVGVAMANEYSCGYEEHIHDDSCYALELTCEEETKGLAEHTHDSSCYETVQTLICGLEESDGEGEHVHDASCYATEEVLTCGLEETGATHVHDDSCYASVLVCDIPEHVHTVECLIDEEADVETAKDWEATLPELTGNYAYDVVSVAQSQIGYRESETNFAIVEDGETRNGYTRYGAWYGNDCGDWDAMFASFCLYYAGVPEEAFPQAAGAWAWIVELEKMGLYADAAEVQPAPGDLVFFDTDEDDTADTVAIVTAIDENGLTVIQGDCDDAVCENTIDPEDETIVGYGLLPEQETSENAETTVDGEEDAADAEDAVIETAPQQELPEDAESTGKGETYEASVDGILVTVTAPKGTLPEGAELAVVLYDEESREYAEAAEAIGADLMTLSADDEPETGVAVLDISFRLDGEEVEPTETVQVTLDVSSIVPEDAGTVAVQHLVETDSGVEPEIVATVSADDPVAEFEVESFSVFTVEWSDGTDDTIEVRVYNMNGTSINETLDEDSSLIASNGTIAISELVAHLQANSNLANEYTYQYATVIYETNLGGPGYSSDTLGSSDNSVVSISKNGTTYTVTYADGTRETVSNPALIQINLYYSIPTVTLSTENLYDNSVSFTVDSEYFQHEDEGTTTYTWTLSDSSAGTLTEGESGTATFAWDTDTAQAGDQVTVTKTVIYTDSEGVKQTETASDAYTLTYGEDPVTFTVTLNGTPQANAHVAIVDEYGNTISTGTTDENGQITLYTIDGGTYTVGVTYCVADTSGMGGGSTSRYTAEGTVTLSGDGTVVTGDTTLALGTAIVSGPNGGTSGSNAGGSGPYYYEHIDVKVAAASTEDTQVSFSDLDAVYVYDKYGNLIYVSEDLERNPETGDYNCLFDINGAEDQHSIVVSSEDTIIIVYEVMDSDGNYSTYTATYTGSGTYPAGEYYPYDSVNAYQLYNCKYGTNISETDWESALNNGTLANLLGDNYTENGIDIGGMSHTVVADYLCDTRTTSGQAGLDFVIDVQEVEITEFDFRIAKEFVGYPEDEDDANEGDGEEDEDMGDNENADNEEKNAPNVTFTFTLTELNESAVSRDVWTVSDETQVSYTTGTTNGWTSGTNDNGDAIWSSLVEFEQSRAIEAIDGTYNYYFVLSEVPSSIATADVQNYGIRVQASYSNGVITLNVSYCELEVVENENDEDTTEIQYRTGNWVSLSLTDVYDEDNNLIDSYYALPFVNTYSENQAELPNTGGIGTYWYTTAGLLLITGAAYLLYRNTRKQRGYRKE